MMFSKAISRMQAIAGHRFPEALVEALEKNLTHEGPFETGHSLLNPGEVCDKLWFIAKGAAKSVLYAKKKERILRFFQQKDIVSGLTSFLRGEPGLQHIVTLEPTEVVSITKKAVEALSGQFTEFLTFKTNLIARYWSLDSEAMINMQNGDVIEMYDLLKETCPKLINRLDIKDMAAYLGVSKTVAGKIKSEGRKGLKIIPYDK
jgi:CRP-like cAMP-binding protein